MPLARRRRCFFPVLPIVRAITYSGGGDRVARLAR